jgi:hypothetical protein
MRRLKAVLFLVNLHNPSRIYGRLGKINQRRQHNGKAAERGAAEGSGNQSEEQVSAIYF